MLNSIAIVTDGNRRFSKKQGIGLKDAYIKGFDKAEEVFDWCMEIPSIDTATVYALSTENLKRNFVELKVLFSLYTEYFKKLADNQKIHDRQVRVRIIGERDQIQDKALLDAINYLEESTKNYDKKKLNIALAYGGRAELVHAIKNIDGEVTEEAIQKNLYEPQDVDLVIRTGGTQRLSNFLTWQTAYAELFFTDKLWPELDKETFNEAIKFYEDTKRNFGK